MDKQELLSQLGQQYQHKLVTKEEILATIGETGEISPNKKEAVAHTFYYLGGAIVVVGITILIGQNWSNLNTATKVLSTLGSGIAAFVAGILLRFDKKLQELDTAFFFISALVMPIGLSVAFNIAGLDLSSPETQILISGILSLMYLASFVVFRDSLFIIFSIIYATVLYYTFTNLLFRDNPSLVDLKFIEIRTLTAGLSYILLGYYFSQGARKDLTGALYGFGVLAFLGAIFALGGWSSSKQHSLFWEIVFPFVDFGVIFLSLQLKSKSFLVFGSLFLMAYILKITAEYFSSSLGWPLALVFSGLALIAIGYLTFYLNREYFVARPQ